VNTKLKQRLGRRRVLQWLAAAPILISSNAWAEDPMNIGSVTSIAPRLEMQGKLATKTATIAQGAIQRQIKACPHSLAA
jgi:hypothetical protein